VKKAKELLEVMEGSQSNQNISEDAIYKEGRRKLSQYEASLLADTMIALLMNDLIGMPKSMKDSPSASRVDFIRSLLGVSIPEVFDGDFDYEAQKEAEVRAMNKLHLAVFKAMRSIKPMEMQETW